MAASRRKSLVDEEVSASVWMLVATEEFIGPVLNLNDIAPESHMPGTGKRCASYLQNRGSGLRKEQRGETNADGFT